MNISKIEYEDAIKYVLSEYNQDYSSDNIDYLREILRSYFVIDKKSDKKSIMSYFICTDVPQNKISDIIIDKMNTVLQYELVRTKITNAQCIPTVNQMYPVSIWHGDITTLNIDCIVTSNHTNKIVLDKAGPQLINDLLENDIDSMYIFPGYNLIAKYIFYFDTNIICDSKQLSENYIACLDKMRSMRKNTIGLCYINSSNSKIEACIIVLNTIKQWLHNNFYKPVHIIFCSNDIEIYNIYNEYAPLIYI
jgi:O-acetyl-ADP-ribose deacetylase (regulator of RNase III)